MIAFEVYLKACIGICFFLNAFILSIQAARSKMPVKD